MSEQCPIATGMEMIVLAGTLILVNLSYVLFGKSQKPSIKYINNTFPIIPVTTKTIVSLC